MRIRLLIAAAAWLLPAAASLGETVHYAKPSHAVHGDYLRGLLDLALAAPAGPACCARSSRP